MELAQHTYRQLNALNEIRWRSVTRGRFKSNHSWRYRAIAPTRGPHVQDVVFHVVPS